MVPFCTVSWIILSYLLHFKKVIDGWRAGHSGYFIVETSRSGFLWSVHYGLIQLVLSEYFDQTPLSDMASVLSKCPSEIGDPHYDDPSLALLFSQLRSKTLQTAKGTSEISGRTEFNFVLQTARVFTRMGMSPGSAFLF
jgi:hypothetical protein